MLTTMETKRSFSEEEFQATREPLRKFIVSWSNRVKNPDQRSGLLLFLLGKKRKKPVWLWGLRPQTPMAIHPRATHGCILAFSRKDIYQGTYWYDRESLSRMSFPVTHWREKQVDKKTGNYNNVEIKDKRILEWSMYMNPKNKAFHEYLTKC